jgi:hypothetical protein
MSWYRAHRMLSTAASECHFQVATANDATQDRSSFVDRLQDTPETLAGSARLQLHRFSPTRVIVGFYKAAQFIQLKSAMSEW